LKFDSLVHRIPDRIHFLPWPILVHFVISFLPSFLTTRSHFNHQHFFKVKQQTPKKREKTRKKEMRSISILFKALFLRT
jgi:hypothetical protein